MYKEAIKTAGAKMDKTIEIIEKDLSTPVSYTHLS